MNTAKLSGMVPAAIIGLSLCALVSAHADLVAYWPMTDGPEDTVATIADDIIDDPNHGAMDATANNENAMWVFDATRDRIVLSTVEGNRFGAGVQDIDLGTGFSWSLWVNVASSNATDPNADSIIGSRSGTWNKIDIGGGPFNGVTSWAGISGNLYDLADDAWHHLAFVGDAVDVSFYIDGVLVGTDTAVSPATLPTDPLEIGGTSRFSEDVTGLYSDVAIWNERLPEERIRGLAAGDPVVEEVSFAITSIRYDPGTDMLTLTWDADEDATYTVRYSMDLVDWGGDIGDSLTMAANDENPDDGDFLTATFDLAGFGLGAEGDLFFRVESE